jgi:hypothetical protein
LDLKPPKHPTDAKEEEAAKQEAFGESAAMSKESSDTQSSCHHDRPGKTASNTEEEEVASSPRAPPTQSPFTLLDAVVSKVVKVVKAEVAAMHHEVWLGSQ